MAHSDLNEYIYRFSYLGIYLWFAVLEQLTPIPEEVSLMTLGYISVRKLNPVACGLIALIGLLTTDSFLFFISAKGSKYSDNNIKKLNSKILNRIRTGLKNNAGKTIFIMALLPKLRFLSPIVAGIGKISWKFFLLFNSIATALNVAIYMLLGILFHNQLQKVLHELAFMQHAIFIVSMITLAVFIFIGVRKIIVKTA